MGTSDRPAGPTRAGLGPDERRWVRDGLTLLDYADPGMASRATNFVLDGTGADVLLELGARPAAELSILLGEPGRLITWRHHDDMYQEIGAALEARTRLYRALPTGGVPVAVLDALVRLGQVLDAADAGHSLRDPGAGAPRWLQYLVNDALMAAHTSRGHWVGSEVPTAVDIALVAALLACDGSHDPEMALRVGFERKGVVGAVHVQPRYLDPLVHTPAAARFMRAHRAPVERLPDQLSTSGRSVLAHRIGGDPELLTEFAELMVTLAVDDDPQVRAAASPYLERLPEPRRVEILLPVLTRGGTVQRREATELLARCSVDAVLAPLREAAAHEQSARVRQALTAAVDRLEGRPVDLPPIPPCDPIPDPPLGAAAFAVLATQREVLREQARDGVDQAAEAMRVAAVPGHHYQYDYDQACYRRDGLQALFDDDLWTIVHVVDGRPGAEIAYTGHQPLLVRAVGELIRVVDRRGELAELPGWSGAHLVRWLRVTRDPHRWRGLWNDRRFQHWLAGRPEESVELRALAQLQVPDVADPDTIARQALWAGGAPIDRLQADHVWPFFAEHPEYVDQGLGLVARPGSGPESRNRSHPHLMLEVLGTFPVLLPRWIPPLLDLAFGGEKGPRRWAQRVLAKQPDAVRHAVSLLAHPDGPVRAEVAAWLGRLGHREAVEPLTAALAAEKQEAVRAGLLTALEALGADLSAYLSPEVLRAEAVKGLRAKVPAALSWFPFDELPPCRWADGTEVASEIVRWWVVLAAKLKDPGNALLTRYLGLLADTSRAAVGETVLREFIAHDTRRPSDADAIAYARVEAPARYARYQQQRAEYLQWYRDASERTQEQYAEQYAEVVEKVLDEDDVVEQCRTERLGEYLGSAIAAKGILALASGAAGHVTVRLLRQYLRDHYLRRAQCEAMVDAVAGTDDVAVIQFLLGVSRRFRTAAIQQRALQNVTAIARRKGWTDDELADRTVPAAGLDRTGTLTLSFGTRDFTVAVDAAMKPQLRTAEGRPIKALPAARPDEDPAVVKEAKQQLSAHRAELKQVVELQTDRLREAMCTERSWPVEEWRRYLLNHPVLGRLVQRLVWLGLDPGRTAAGGPQGFRPDAGGRLVDVDGEELELDAGTRVRLAHATLLSPSDRRRWAAHLTDHGVAPLFDQLAHLLPDLAQRAPSGGPSTHIEDRAGWVGDTFTLRAAFTRRGYRRDDAEDGGFFYRYTKSFSTVGIRVAVAFSGNALPEENRPAALTSLGFEKIHVRRGKDGPLPLADVPRVLLAEAYADYHAVAAACGGFDPGWEQVTPW